MGGEKVNKIPNSKRASQIRTSYASILPDPTNRFHRLRVASQLPASAVSPATPCTDRAIAPIHLRDLVHMRDKARKLESVGSFP